MEELQFLRNAWNTSIEMISARDYIVDNTYNLINDADFKHLVSEKKLDIFAENNDKTKAILVKFIIIPKIKPSSIKGIIDEIRENSEYTNMELILILKTKPNNTVLKIEKEKNINNVQIMWCKQLQYNITKHTLVPKHTICSLEEEDIIMKKYSLVNKMQLPLLLRDDPVSRYYNYKLGDVIKITNTSSSINPNYEFYRCVK